MSDFPVDLTQLAQSQAPPPIPSADNLPITSNAPPQSPTGAAMAQMQAGQRPQTSNQPPVPMPILAQLIRGLVKPPQTPPDQMGVTRPVSRLDTFESFLGNFVNALGHGLAAAHGPGAFGKGFGAAVTAPYEQAQQQFQQSQAAQANQAQIQREQAQTQLTQEQTRLAGTMVTLPNGMTVPSKVAEQYLKGAGAAQINSKAHIDLAKWQFMIQQGQISKVLDGKDDQGNLVKIGYNKQGQPVATMQGALPSAQYLPKDTQTTVFQQDKDGNIIALPKGTQRSVQLPGPTTQSQPQGGSPSGFPKNGGTKSGGGPRIVALGKSAADVGLAYDPAANEYVQTTRTDAAKQGLQQFNKITAPEQEANRQLNNRLSDVAQKITRYEGMLNQPLSQDDKDMISGVLSRDDFQLGAHAFGAGVEIPVDRLNQWLDAHNVKNMSGPAKQTLLAYENAREAMTGYQRVLSGSGKSSDKNLELNLATLPSPVMPNDYIKEGIRQFKENVNIAGQGLPRMPGITRAKDIFAQSEPVQVQIPGQPMGTIPRGKLAEFQKKYPAAKVIQ